MTSLGSMPTVWASCIGSRWSGPPGTEPPPTARAFGSAFHAVTRSSIVLYGEFLATTMAPDSSISLAIGVVWSSLASDWLVYWAPTTPSPIIINSLPLPFSETVRDRPTVPPAPARLNTSMFSVAPMSSITFAAARAVVSYPLPGSVRHHEAQPGRSARRPAAEPPGSASFGGRPAAGGQQRCRGDDGRAQLESSEHHRSFVPGPEAMGESGPSGPPGGRDHPAIANRALSACGHDGRCGLYDRTPIAPRTRLCGSQSMAETDSMLSIVQRRDTVRQRLRTSLASQLVLVQLMMAAVLLAVSAVSVEQSRISFQRDQGQPVLVLAEVLAASPIVRGGLLQPTAHCCRF